MTPGQKITNIGWAVTLVYGCPLASCDWAPPIRTLPHPSDEELDVAENARHEAILVHAEGAHTVRECVESILSGAVDS